MDTASKQASEQLQLAEAELAVLRQEQVLRELVNTAEPTAEATALLRQLREVAERLAGSQEGACGRRGRRQEGQAVEQT